MLLVENLLVYIWPTTGKSPITIPFQRITYNEAMEKYGCDKPDTRFDMKLNDVSDCLAFSKTDVVNDFGAYAVVFSVKGNKKYRGAIKEELNKLAEKFKNCKFSIIQINTVSIFIKLI